MMETKIFLQGFNSKKSVNASDGLNVDLRGKRRLLPTNDVAEVISQYDQYIEEREACNIIRLTCQVNPICSNVLFNRITEIVKDEGSSAITYINYNVTPSSNESRYVDYGEDDEKLRYKRRDLSFWTGGTFNYQSVDEEISDFGPDNVLYDAVSGHVTHYSDSGITSSIKHPSNSIRDMQLSYCGYVYHCGLDIMNNHLIRSKTFKCVCKMPNDQRYAPIGYSDDYGAFNTIADLMRDINGYKVIEKVIYPGDSGISSGGYENLKFIVMHLYKYDDIYTYNECINKRLLNTFNGWVGFNNKPKIKTYEVFSVDHLSEPSMIGKAPKEIELHIERPLMYMNGGDFVDMYPDRSLYSFVPKFNHFRNRIEKNWNYCLTYPSSSYTPSDSNAPFSDIMEYSNRSMKAIYFDENTKSDNGVTQLVIYSIAKHGLSVGDYVNIYNNTITSYTYNNEVYLTKTEVVNKVKADHPSETNVEKYITNNVLNTKIIDNAEVSDVVDEYIFTILNADVQISKEWVEITNTDFMAHSFTINNVQYKIEDDRKTCYTGEHDKIYYIINTHHGYYVNIDDSAQNLSYKKVVNDIECEYYIRIFSKIPNFKNASADTSNQYQIYKNDGELISIYQDKEYDFESHVSRLAFAKNIYTDEVGEVVFTDDINIANLHDNLGRPLSSIYLTIVKNNKGYKEWYGYDLKDDDFWNETEITADTVEYSHCFGKITCGIETSYESSCNKKITSIFKITNNPKISQSSGYDVDMINGNRRYINDNYDIASTEVWFDTDKHYYGDLSYYDNYNAIERHIQPIMQRVNTAQRESLQAYSGASQYYSAYTYDEIYLDDYDAASAFTVSSYTIDNANNKNEGYYYIPHYEIPIKTFDKVQTMFPDFLTMRSLFKSSEDTYQITTLENHYLTFGDKAILYDKVNNQYYYCTTVSGENDTYKTFTCKVYNEIGQEVELEDMFSSDEKLKDFKLLKMDNLDIPSYATILKDGSCRVIWRDILNNGFNTSDKSVEEYPFTNGAFYINRRVDLFLRRQDPFNDYGLRDDYMEGVEMDVEKYDNYVKDKDIVC